jgi:hypothetical protein
LLRSAGWDRTADGIDAIADDLDREM